ncbi:aldehyde dehydrogenase [Phellopilus nigrolimitatus]|nr:aldehyde dehydrogenase [Phellopilus nigrolimitatus]
MASTETLLWINGERKSASDHTTFEVRNPLSSKVVGSSASATSQDCKQKSADIFLKAADLVQTEKYKNKFKQALQDETAATNSWVMINIVGSRGGILEAASLASQVKGESFPSSSAIGGHVIVQRRAHGAVLSIAPWNAPVTLTFRAILIPLICGNTVVLKSSEYSPWSQEIVVELMHEAGLPPGVLNYISMSRESSPKLTAELIGNPLIRHVNFTGSDRVGKILAGEAAKYLKPCVFELGGKAPAVVLNDADTDAAARGIAHWRHAALRPDLHVHRARHRAARGSRVHLFPSCNRTFANLQAGNPLTNPATQLSALFTWLREARDSGAELLVGDLNREGTVVQPHLIKGVRPGMRAWERESFGPVVGIAVVDTVDEAIEMANATEYSLSASVWTKDINRALDVASQIRSGNTSINGATFHTEAGLGVAGLGGATGYGRFDIDNFTIKRMIIVHPSKSKFPLVDGW